MPGSQDNSQSVSPVKEEDVRSLVRLLAEVAAMPRDLQAMRHRCLCGVAELIDADAWLWGLSRGMIPGQLPTPVSFLYWGITPEGFALVIKGHTDLEHRHPLASPCVEAACGDRHVTRLRQQWISDEEWYAHPAIQLYQRPAGIDQCVYTVRPMPEADMAAMLAFHRSWGRPAFTARDARIVHIVTAEVGWLLEEGLPGDRGERTLALSPRLRSVLVLLLDGHSVKEAAHHLGLSSNTVSGYVKAIYRHFGVSSRGELFRCFASGDGGDGV